MLQGEGVYVSFWLCFLLSWITSDGNGNDDILPNTGVPPTIAGSGQVTDMPLSPYRPHNVGHLPDGRIIESTNQSLCAETPLIVARLGRSSKADDILSATAI